MKTLREYVKEAEEKKIAIGHFNISNLEGLHGVYQAAKKLNVPVIIGLSEGEEDFVGRDEAIAMIKTIREKENFPIFLNADHHYSFERVKLAIDAGFDSVIFDGAKLNFDENVKITKQCIEYARSVNPEIIIEAEIGYIGSGSNIKESIPEGAGLMTKPDEAKRFVEITGVDMLAPSVGNIHGIIKGGNPHIDAELVKEIRKEAGVPLVLHGGSGISDPDFIKGIRAGISIIHISTELRLAYDEALKKSLADNPGETTPYKILQPAVEAMEKVAEARLKLFNGIE
jgi:fructose-bisphosphate aldolase class II